MTKSVAGGASVGLLGLVIFSGWAAFGLYILPVLAVFLLVGSIVLHWVGGLCLLVAEAAQRRTASQPGSRQA